LGYVERLAMRKKRLQGPLSMVRGTRAKIKIGIYSKQKAGRKAGMGETLGELMRVGPARERVVLHVGA
jgi:hypothetical protein